MEVLATGLDRAEAALRVLSQQCLGSALPLSPTFPCVVLHAGPARGCSGPTPFTTSELADPVSSPGSVFPSVHHEGAGRRIGSALSCPSSAPPWLFYPAHLPSLGLRPTDKLGSERPLPVDLLAPNHQCP